MEIVLGFHLISNGSDYLGKETASELIKILRKDKYPPESSRKCNRPRSTRGSREPRAKREKSARMYLKEMIRHSLSKSWELSVPIHDDLSIPGAKLHFVRNRVGVIVSLQHRTSVGTDILRFAVARRSSVSQIDLGIFVCGTSEFEEYYFGTEYKQKENMVTFEEIQRYMEMLGDIIDTPIIVIGIKAPAT